MAESPVNLVVAYGKNHYAIHPASRRKFFNGYCAKAMMLFLQKREWIIFFVTCAAGAALLAFIYFNIYGEKGERAFYWGGADSGEYLALADNVLAGRGFSIHREEPYEIGATRTPGYPLIVAFAKLIGGNYGVLLLMVFQITTLGAIGVLSYRLFNRFFNERVSSLLSFLVILHPQMLLITFTVMSDIFFILFFLLSFYYFLLFWERETPQSLWSSAALLGIATAIRPGGLFVFIIYFLFLIPRLWRAIFNRKFLRDFTYAAIAALLFLLPQIPWSIRNYAQFGTVRPTPADTYNLYYVMLPTIIAERDGISRETAQAALHEELAAQFPGFTRGRAHDTFAYTAQMGRKVKDIVLDSPSAVFRIAVREIPVLLLQAEWARPFDKWQIVPAASEPVSLRQEIRTNGFAGATTALRQKIACGISCFLPSLAILFGMLSWGALFFLAAAGFAASAYSGKMRDPAFLCMFLLIAYIIGVHTTFIAVPEIAERYKLPILPFLLIFAFFGWRGIRSWGKAKLSF